MSIRDNAIRVNGIRVDGIRQLYLFHHSSIRNFMFQTLVAMRLYYNTWYGAISNRLKIIFTSGIVGCAVMLPVMVRNAQQEPDQ